MSLGESSFLQPFEDVDTAIRRLSSEYKGVQGCIVVSPQGEVLKTTCQPEVAEEHASLIPQLASIAENMTRDLDPQDELQDLRVLSRKRELVVIPCGDVVLIVVLSTATEPA